MRSSAGPTSDGSRGEQSLGFEDLADVVPQSIGSARGQGPPVRARPPRARREASPARRPRHSPRCWSWRSAAVGGDIVRYPAQVADAEAGCARAPAQEPRSHGGGHVRLPRRTAALPPTLTRRPAPAAAAPRTSRPDPGGRCSARRGTRRGPWSRASGRSPSAPASAAAAAAASDGLAPSPPRPAPRVRRRRPASAHRAWSSRPTVALPSAPIPRDRRLERGHEGRRPAIRSAATAVGAAAAGRRCRRAARTRRRPC